MEGVQNERIRYLNKTPVCRKRYVLIWIQQSQRSEYNHALVYAIGQANRLSVPVVAYFGLTDRYPEANERHYAFMADGLRELKETLAERGIRLVVLHCSPEKGALLLAKDACLVVTDRGYLRHQTDWRTRVADEAGCRVVQVETDLIVPVEEASPKEEFSAGTFRPKISKKLSRFFLPLTQSLPKKDSLDMAFDYFDPDPARLDIDRSVGPSAWLKGGTSDAKRLLDEFIERKLDFFSDLRNDPSKDCLSYMSPYLHFGQISPLYIALTVMKADSPGKDSYLEELIVRRELAMNFVRYNPCYDSFESLPEWAKRTLTEHQSDRREYCYSEEQLENAETHDEYWNAAQKEMIKLGKMHGYMRMYWGKKILEWSVDPKQAYRTACYLNNKYSLDGRDPASFTGVAWCFGKHDRAWQERAIFGKVRYMNDRGLRRKFDIDGYVRRVEGLDRP